jgi:histidinol dehydrogenase
MAQVRTLDTAAADFDDAFDALVARLDEADEEVERRVREIISRVRREGDAALLDLTRRLDGVDVADAAALEVPAARLDAALAATPAPRREALESAVARVRRYHERQRQESWRYEDQDGVLLGQQVTPLDRAGLYVPGRRR